MNIHKRLCDYCEKVVAKKLILWHTTEPYTRIRVDFPDCNKNTTREIRHMCNACLNKIHANTKAQSENVALRAALKQSEEIREYYEAVAASLGHELNPFETEQNGDKRG